MSSSIDPTKLKVVDLRTELTSRGLDSKGNKAVLIKRLKDALDKEVNQEPSNAPVTAEDQDAESEDAAQDEKMEVEEPVKVEPVKPPEKTRERRRSTAKAAEKRPEPKIEPKIIEKPEPAAPPKPKPQAQSPEKPKVEQPKVKPVSEKPKAEAHPPAAKPKSDSPVKAKVESPVKVKQESPVKVRQESPVKVKQQSPVKAPQESPDKVKVESPLKIKTDSPVKVLSESPVKIKADDIQELDKEKSAENGAEDSEVDKSKSMTNEGEDKEEGKDEDMKEESKGVETERSRGDKRKRSASPERSSRKHSPPPRSPVRENEPSIDSEKVQLSWYDSDLHLQVDSEKFLSAKPLTDGAFSYAWAGVRATHGVSTGQVCYEVKITEEIKFDDFLKHESQRSQNKGRDRYKTDHRKKDKVKRSSDKRSRDQKSKDKKEDDSKAKDDSSKEETDKNDDSKQADKDESITEEKNDSVNEEENESAHDDKDDAATEEKDDAATEEKDDAATEEKVEDAPMETDQSKESESMDVTPAEGDDQSADASKVKSDEKSMETDDGTEGKDQKEDKPDETKAPEPEPIPSPAHLVRIGWSLTSCSLQLGEDKFSYGYDSSGKFVTDNESADYGIKFALGDVVGAFLDIGEEEVVIRYTVNGAVQPVAATIPKSDLPEVFVLFPHVMTHNCSFELNFGDKEEAWFAVPDDLEDYTFLSKTEDKVSGPPRPDNRSDCEVIMMWGLLACGKTHWVNEHVAANPDKRYYVIGNSSFMKKVTISGEPLKSRIKAIFIDKIQKCLNRLVWMAATRRRNYIIDQTNEIQSAQRRKMRPFEGFKRRAVVIVLGDEEQARRLSLQEEQDGLEVPASSVLEMKAAMFLPEKCEWFDEIIYPELGEEEAKEIVKKYNALGKEAGYGTTKRFKHDRYDRRSEYRGRSYHERSSNYRRYEPKRGWSSERSRGGGGSWNRDRRDSRTSSSRDWRPSSGYSRDRGYRDSYSYSGSEHRSHGGRSSSRGYQGSGGGSRGYGGSRGSGHRGQAWSNSGSGSWNQGGTGWNQQTFGSGGYGSQHWGGQQYNKGGGQGYGNWSYGQHGQGSWNSQK